MKSFTIILAVFLFLGSLTPINPQQTITKKNIEQPTKVDTINFDSIEQDAIKKINNIKSNRNEIEINETKSKQIELEVKSISKEIREDLNKLKQQEIIIKIDSLCDNKEIKLFAQNNCNSWKLDTIKIIK